MMKNIQRGANHWIPTKKKNKKTTIYKQILLTIQTYFIQSSLTPHIRSALGNSRSIRNKIPMIIEFLIDFYIDILIITETLLSLKDCPLQSSLNIDPYSLSLLPRSLGMREGGLGILYKSFLHISQLIDHRHAYCEAFSCSVSSPRSRIFNMSVFYRSSHPPISR